MIIHSLQFPCTALFLLLLLPPSLLRSGRLQHHSPGWRTFHHLGKGSRNFHLRHGPGAWHQWYPRQAEEDCQGAFDLYFILDKSGSIKTNWKYIYDMVEDLVNKFKNPNMRMSFVLYEREAETLMPLTGDRQKIKEGLEKLSKVQVGGATFMNEGFKLVNAQIRNAKSGDIKATPMIIALTDGELEPEVFEDTKKEANKARGMGAVVYTVGVQDYKKDQMIAVADSSEHMVGVKTGFTGLKGIVEPLAFMICIEITSVEASNLCAGAPYEVFITGQGFHNAKKKDQIVCRFKFKDNTTIDKKPTSSSDISINCPGPVIKQPNETVFIEVSLNNGETFLGNRLNITSTSCGGGGSSNTVQTKPTVTSGVIHVEKTYDYDLRFLALLPLLLLIPLLLYFCWRLCFMPKEEPPPVPEKKPKPPPPPPVPPPINPCPTVIVSCCGCRPRVIKGNSWCQYIPPRCRQMPMTWYHPRDQRSCGNFVMLKPQCGQVCCSPKIVLQPSRECCHFTQSPCSPKICLAPSREYFPVPQELCTSGICLQPARECCSCCSMPQTTCTPRVCLQPSRGCLSLNSYPQCQSPPSRYSQSRFSMLPLLPPSARKSIESVGHSYYPCPTSKRPKT